MSPAPRGQAEGLSLSDREATVRLAREAPGGRGRGLVGLCSERVGEDSGGTLAGMGCTTKGMAHEQPERRGSEGRALCSHPRALFCLHRSLLSVPPTGVSHGTRDAAGIGGSWEGLLLPPRWLEEAAGIAGCQQALWKQDWAVCSPVEERQF